MSVWPVAARLTYSSSASTGKAQALVEVRRARPADGPAVREFVFATLRAYGITPDPDGLDADVVAFGCVTDPAIHELVAAADGRVVGSVVISARGDGTAHLSKFFVNADYRGRGIGRALLRHAVGEARARGYRQLDLETRSVYREAVHLYEATGWVRGPDLPDGYGPDRTYRLNL
jgi:ribosomal protein S18 acetylase RimI-like enzyme